MSSLQVRRPPQAVPSPTYKMVAGQGIEPCYNRTAYETVVMRQLNFPAMKTWLPQMESNHLPVGYQPTARPESFAAMDPGGRLELPCQPYQSSPGEQSADNRQGD